MSATQNLPVHINVCPETTITGVSDCYHQCLTTTKDPCLTCHSFYSRRRAHAGTQEVCRAMMLIVCEPSKGDTCNLPVSHSYNVSVRRKWPPGKVDTFARPLISALTQDAIATIWLPIECLFVVQLLNKKRSGCSSHHLMNFNHLPSFYPASLKPLHPPHTHTHSFTLLCKAQRASSKGHLSVSMVKQIWRMVFLNGALEKGELWNEGVLTVGAGGWMEYVHTTVCGSQRKCAQPLVEQWETKRAECFYFIAHAAATLSQSAPFIIHVLTWVWHVDAWTQLLRRR